MTIFSPDDYLEEREVDLVILCVGPNRMQVAKILRRGGWSYQGIREVLIGLVNWIKATGLTSAHQLASVGMTLRVEEKVCRRQFAGWDGLMPAYSAAAPFSTSVRFFGPGYTISRRERPRRWAEEFRSSW